MSFEEPAVACFAPLDVRSLGLAWHGVGLEYKNSRAADEYASFPEGEASDEISDEEMLGRSGMRDESEGERERLTCFAMQEEQGTNGERVVMSGGSASNLSYNLGI